MESNHIKKREQKCKDKIQEDETNSCISGKKRITPKERAKIHRMRKQKYYEELETKVKALEQEVKVLKDQNCKLKQLSKSD